MLWQSAIRSLSMGRNQYPVELHAAPPPSAALATPSNNPTP